MSYAYDVTSSWTRIVRWLERNAPASARALNPPATEVDIQHLNHSLGFHIPEPLETWLRLNNGSTAKDSRIPIPGGFQLIPHVGSSMFPGGEVFLDCQSTINRYRDYLRIAHDIGDEDWWKPSWIPVLAAADGHYGVILDAGQTDGSIPVLAYRETAYAKVYASSLEQLLTGVADVLEHGQGNSALNGQGNSALTRGYRVSVQDERVVWS
ncbi:SMI1/KNR4 family protein [Streptomyces sp. NPDC096142]|uniref:SMI1/KNR4 family protein n=1 Tax=Streptomyces sp. NPDC096142 TaxID=3366077 RepID=UPI0037F4174D